MSELARLLDPGELDRAEGPRGRMTLDVPSTWLEAGDTITIDVPALLVCARCEGGGCDACGRSGAVRLELDESARTFSFTLPRTTGERVLVRLQRPLGDDAGLEQLAIELRAREASLEAVAGVRRVTPPETPVRLTLRPLVLAAAIAMALALAIAAGLR